MLRSVFLERTAVEPRVSWKDVGQDEFDICIVLCFGCRNVLTLVRYALRNVRVTHETSENVEDGVARWTAPFTVGCDNLNCNGLSEAANLAKFNEGALSCRETLGVLVTRKRIRSSCCETLFHKFSWWDDL